MLRVTAAVVGLLLTVGACECGAPVPCEGKAGPDEVCIPGGTFIMGHDPLPVVDDLAPPLNDWAPPHPVQLDPFFIDQHKVTWGEYTVCVDAGVCSTKGMDFNQMPHSLLHSQEAADRPTGLATYYDALDYCTWKGKRLPTEAEWERAARGPADSDYPWGNDAPTQAMLAESVEGTGAAIVCADGVPCDGSCDSQPPPAPGQPCSQCEAVCFPKVDTHTWDVTSEGVHDMYSVPAEWVADAYQADYYAHSPSYEPKGPPNGSSRVVRGRLYSTTGASWKPWHALPAWTRHLLDPNDWRGFRCARDGRPGATGTSTSGLGVYHNLRWHGYVRKAAP